jgi:hypothetical protein
MSFEDNIRRSFQGVKKDILEIKNQLLKLAEMQEKLVTELEEMKSEKTVAKPKAKKRTSKRK